ncbi:unnamed protein product [Clonostachys rhizophaga]|uniref:Uncharacterized protein n=1 Tax=Clonostachys rhizophaga TaxID=160324 RepID=A0A9N9VWK5_9HYPO|nr:unnamed protein product [Clonostachys rhizophaga]
MLNQSPPSAGPFVEPTGRSAKWILIPEIGVARDRTESQDGAQPSHPEGIFISFDPRIKAILEQVKDRAPITHQAAKNVLSDVARNPKRLPGHASGSDVPATVGTAEVKSIAESDVVGGAHYFFETVKQDPDYPPLTSVDSFVKWGLSASPALTRLFRRCIDVVLHGKRRLLIYADTPFIQQ